MADGAPGRYGSGWEAAPRPSERHPMKCETCMLAWLSALTLTASAQTFTLTDYTGRGFAPDVVTYSIAVRPTEIPQLRLTDAQGRPVAFQVMASAKAKQSLLSFVTGLPANGDVAFTLERDGKGPLGRSALEVGTEGDALVLANALCAVKVPGPASETFAPPVPAHTLPPPILAFRSGASGAWWGAGKVLSSRGVKARRVTVAARGPAFAEVRYELDYDGGGYYRAVVRLADRTPIVRVTEEYDLGRMASVGKAADREADRDWRTNPGGRVLEKDLWELDLTKGWQPDTVEMAAAWGNGSGGDMGRTVALAEYQTSLLMNAGAYGANRISTFGLFRAADKKAGPDYPGVGVTPLHNGFWRRAMDLEVARSGRDQVILRLPMTRTSPRWVETSPFCVATHEPNKPYTYARRQWGLVLGALPVPVMAGFGKAVACRAYQARLTYGTVGLDRYKDYILDWPDSKLSYPRAFVRVGQIGKYRAALTPDNPLTQCMTERSYALSGNETLVSARAVDYKVSCLDRLIWSALGFAAQSHHVCSDAGRFAAHAEDVLSFPGLPAAKRQALRARLALLTYLFTDPDINGQGSGSHTGNPNMSLARQGWISTVIAMLPDHPLYASWRDYMTQWTAFKFADNMAPAGGWFEPGTYQEWGYQRLIWSLLGLEAMKVRELDRLRAYHLADSEFYLNLLTPYDPRWGARMFPGFGNNATHYASIWLDYAAAVEEARPELAEELRWAWSVNGRQLSDVFAAVPRPWIKPKKPVLASRHFPGFGLVFRAHQGPDETYMLLRSGFLWSHWTVDQGNMSLYSKGAVLLPPQPHTYFGSKFPDHSQENDIRFGHPANQFRYAWPDSNILDYRFGARAQYAWASAGYPAWFITPGITAGFGDGPKLQTGLDQKEGEFWWNRQVVFLVGKTAKSPNYFVFHDTIVGDGRLAQWLNFDLLGRKTSVQAQGNRLAVSTEWPVSLDIAFADQRTLAPDLTEEDQLLNVNGVTWAAAAKGKPVSPNWGRADGEPVDVQKRVFPDIERHVLVRIPAEAGADHFWLAYPKAQGESEPGLERLGTNVVKVTHAEGTDYILLSTSHDQFEGQDVVLEGQAAVLRVAPEGITFALLGGAGRVGYKGQVFAGVGAFERTVPADALKPGVRTLKRDRKETLACAPQLKKHRDRAPGVRKASARDRVEYVVDSATPVTFQEGDVRIDARRALITRGPARVRFAAPEGTYVQLSAGTWAARGVGPFDLTLSTTEMTGTVAGRMRTLVISKPEDIVRPMYEMDKVRWYAGYPDDPAPWHDRPEAQFSLAFGVTDGRHEVNVREWESPPMPPVPERIVLNPK